MIPSCFLRLLASFSPGYISQLRFSADESLRSCVDEALQISCTEESNEWLEVGFQSWFAWFKADDDTKAFLATLPSDDRQRIAQHLLSIKADSSTVNFFQHCFYIAARASKRRGE